MEGTTSVLIVLAVLGAAGAVVAFVVQEVVRASGIGVTRTRLEGILETMESVVYDTPRPAGSYAIGAGDPWGDRGPPEHRGRAHRPAPGARRDPGRAPGRRRGGVAQGAADARGQPSRAGSAPGTTTTGQGADAMTSPAPLVPR
jgi:type II secretory pathway pseudopilin PulG